jgi:hypothetical protein
MMATRNGAMVRTDIADIVGITAATMIASTTDFIDGYLFMPLSF